jgi:hypothetical protein
VNTPSVAATFLSALIIFVSESRAQWLDRIQTDSDWEYLYYDGFYDYNTFQLYRELGEGMAIRDTAEYVASTLGNPLSDVAAGPRQYGPRPLYANADSADVLSNHLPRLKLQTGQKFQEGRNSGYILASLLAGNLSMSFKGRNKMEKWQSERRTISYFSHDYDISLGNYTADIGSGLGIGRYDYRPISYESHLSQLEDFLSPDNSYYNGVKFTYEDRIVALYSQKKYNGASKRFAGGSAAFVRNDYEIGVTLSGLSLSSAAGKKTMAAVSAFLSRPQLGFKTEIGYAESGAGVCFRLRRSRFDIRLWHYDPSFVNLQSSAPAHPDYLPFHDDRYELSFRQPQAGESGLFAERDVTLGRVAVTGFSEIWKKSPHDDVAMNHTLLGRLRLDENTAIDMKYSNQRNSGYQRTLLECGSSFTRGFIISAYSSLWIERERIQKARTIAWLYGSLPLPARSARISGRLRWNFDGELDYIIETVALIYNQISLKGTYRWQHSYGNNLGPLYLVMERSI